jgi:hypothetical protein
MHLHGIWIKERFIYDDHTNYKGDVGIMYDYMKSGLDIRQWKRERL